jgi:hypothetical protein
MSQFKMCFWVVVLGIVLRFGCHTLLPSGTVTSQLPLNAVHGHNNTSNNTTTEATATMARGEIQDMKKYEEYVAFVNNIEKVRMVPKRHNKTMKADLKNETLEFMFVGLVGVLVILGAYTFSSSLPCPNVSFTPSSYEPYPEQVPTEKEAKVTDDLATFNALRSVILSYRNREERAGRKCRSSGAKSPKMMQTKAFEAYESLTVAELKDILSMAFPLLERVFSRNCKADIIHIFLEQYSVALHGLNKTDVAELLQLRDNTLYRSNMKKSELVDRLVEAGF